MLGRHILWIVFVFLWFVLRGPPLAAADIVSNLTLYWPLDTGSGTTATAGGGTSITGALIDGPTWESGVSCTLGACLTFNGSSQYISASPATLSAIITATAGTMSLWAKPTGTPSAGDTFGLPIIFGDSDPRMGIFHGNPGGAGAAIWAMIYDGTERRVAATYTAGQWVHIAAVLGSGVLQIYRNGSFVDQVATGSPEGLGGTVVVARADSAPFYAGVIDEVKAWNRALSASDVAEEYARGVPVAPRRRPVIWSWDRELRKPQAGSLRRLPYVSLIVGRVTAP